MWSAAMRPWRLAGPGQRHLRRLARHEVLDLDGVSHGVDVRVAGLKVFVDPDAATRTDFQARLDRQLVLRAHADAEDDQLGRQALARLQPDDEAIRRLLERLGGLAEQQRHALARQFLGDGRRHLLVERRQHLVLQLDHRGCDAPAHEVLDQFQADEARPDDDGLLHALVHAGLDAVHVLQVPQGEDAGQVDAGQRRAQRCRTWGEDQLVVGFLVLPPRSEVTDTDLLRRPVDGLHGGPHPHVQVEAGPQALRRDDEQLVPLGDLAAEVVRQAAVGERHVRPPLEQDDVGVFRQATGTGGCRCAAGHATDDEQFHEQTSFVAQQVAGASLT